MEGLEIIYNIFFAHSVKTNHVQPRFFYNHHSFIDQHFKNNVCMYAPHLCKVKRLLKFVKKVESLRKKFKTRFLAGKL